MATYPELSKFEKALFSYLSTDLQLSSLATVSEANPNTSGELGDKGRVTISFLNTLDTGMARLITNPAYQFACWDFGFAKSRRLQEVITNLIENWITPGIDDLSVLTPVRERLTGPDLSKAAQLHFSIVVYRFPITRV